MSLENLSFKGGYHMHDFKEIANNCPIEEGPVPAIVEIALHQHIGAPCLPLVEKGDVVKVGQKIGEAKATISAPVHASVSGTVLEIKEITTVAGFKTKAVVIENDGRNELGYEEKNDDYTLLSAEEIISRVREAGVVGLGGAGFPTSVKLQTHPGEKIEEIIINGAECEPFLTSDQVSMETYPEKVVTGCLIAMQAMEAAKGYIGIEDNKPNAIDAVKNACANVPNVEVAVLKTKYPQGDQKRIVQAITNKVIPSGTHGTAIGVQVFNASTAIAITDAVVYGKPLYEKVVTMTGSAITLPKNIRVKLGTPLIEMLEFCNGFKEEPGKIIVGGPMMGESQFSVVSPSVKTMGGVIVLNKEQAQEKPVSPCIKCGKCVHICPVGLEPLFLQSYSLNGLLEEAEKNHIMECIECGTCSYVCPANRPLVESIKNGKRLIRATQKAR